MERFHNRKDSMIFWQVASVRCCVRIFTQVHLTFGFLATPAQIKDENRLNFFFCSIAFKWWLVTNRSRQLSRTRTSEILQFDYSEKGGLALKRFLIWKKKYERSLEQKYSSNRNLKQIIAIEPWPETQINHCGFLTHT